MQQRLLDKMGESDKGQQTHASPQPSLPTRSKLQAPTTPCRAKRQNTRSKPLLELGCAPHADAPRSSNCFQIFRPQSISDPKFQRNRSLVMQGEMPSRQAPYSLSIFRQELPSDILTVPEGQVSSYAGDSSHDGCRDEGAALKFDPQASLSLLA